MNSYIELHARSAFSFLRAGSLPEQLAQRAAELNLPAVALCDRDGVYGAPRFFAAGQEKGIRAIIGAELTMEDATILPVLVESRTGYQNLCRLITRAQLRSEKGQSAVRWDELPEFAQGLVALTGDEDGPLHPAYESGRGLPQSKSFAPSIVHNSRASVLDCGSPLPLSSFSMEQILHRLVRIFGRANVFIEIQRHHLRGENRWLRACAELAGQFHLPLLATNGVLYAKPWGRQVLDVFTCIRHHTHLDAAGKLLAQNSERHLKDAATMTDLFRDFPQAIANTVRLAERLQFSLTDLGYEFPHYPVTSGETMDSVLRQQTYAGARERYGVITPEVKRQLEHELALITKLGFSGYFLIVADIVKFCRESNIMAQGRGSAANSAVCFSLGITAVDPVGAKLLFERFLSEGRKGWPDIDIDLPSGDRRERVIQEIYRRYGKHGAAMTANVITYRGRSAAREIGKALNVSNDIIDRFSNLFAEGDFPHTLELTAHMEQAGLPRSHPRAETFVSLYRAIYGLPRHLGQHSGGMIICQGQLDSIVPLENASMPGRVVTQWDKDDCEDLGIIKVDLLGLGMMSVLQDALELTRQRGYPVDLAKIPKDDAATFEMMQKADTIGVFQIESRAQMATLPRLKPKCFYDVVVEVAIIRPGPIQGDMVHPYLARRAGREEVTYFDERLRPVLERTLGVPLFQEQMLRIAMVMADFTGSEAEELRRALSFHRSEERMLKVAEKLRDAMARKGVAPDVIDKILKSITSFALYGFPESHAISFAILAYGSAYLKRHYAPEFYTSLLNNQPMGFYSPATIVKDAKHHGLCVRSVCVMRSDWRCTIESGPSEERASVLECASPLALSVSQDCPKRQRTGALQDAGAPIVQPIQDSLRLGLCIVQGLQADHALKLLEERQRQPFTSLEDFKRRVPLNKDELRTLAEIGALNCFAPHRRAALWHAEKTEHPGELPARPSEINNQFSIFNFQFSTPSRSPSPLNGERIPPTNDSRIEPLNRPAGLPLPKGEGRGEGEHSVQQPLGSRIEGLERPNQLPITNYQLSITNPLTPQQDALRLGLCIVQGLEADHALKLLEERQRQPFTSLEDLKRRVPLNKDELRTLAEIGALNCFAPHRRAALWHAEKTERVDELPVRPSEINNQSPTFNFQFSISSHKQECPENVPDQREDQRFTDSPLPPMDIVERMAADYNGTGLTTGPHPMTLARPNLPDVWRACDLPRARHGSFIRIAGNVICRQRPGTAKGFVFISLEDETGTSNAIVTPQLFDQQRLLITQESFLLIEGRVQNVDNVVLIKADRIERLTQHRLVGSHSHDFH